MNSGRQVGVMVPREQLSKGTGAPRQVMKAHVMETFAVEYTDDNGRIIQTVMHRIGGRWLMAPNGENYASTLQPLKPDTWLADTLERRYQVAQARPGSESIPTKDDVDPMEKDEKDEEGGT